MSDEKDGTDYEEFPVEQTDNSVRPEDGDQSDPGEEDPDGSADA